MSLMPLESEKQNKEAPIWAARLDRVEGKLDALIQRMDALIRLEERHDNLARDMTRLDTRLAEQGRELHSLEAHVSRNSFWRDAIEKAFWLVFAAVVGFAGYLARGA